MEALALLRRWAETLCAPMAKTVSELLQDPRVVAALDGVELSDQEKVGLRILLDPDNHPKGADPLAEFAEWRGDDYEFDYQVAAVLEHMYERTEGSGAFWFRHEHFEDGGLNAYYVARALPGRSGHYLATRGLAMSFADGLPGAVSLAGQLASDHDGLKATTDRPMSKNRFWGEQHRRSGSTDATSFGRSGDWLGVDAGRGLMARRTSELLRDSRVSAALAGAHLTDQDKVGLWALLDPDNYPEGGDLDAILAQFAQRKGDDEWDSTVADVLHRMYRRTEASAGAFAFSFVFELDGWRNGYHVSRFLPGDSGQFIATAADVSELLSEDGLLGAVRTAGILASKHAALKATADRLFPGRPASFVL